MEKVDSETTFGHPHLRRLLGSLRIVQFCRARGLRWIRVLEELHHEIRLARDFPQLQALPAKLPRCRLVLEPYYRQYISQVSSPKMAISLELASFILAACYIRRPRRIADFGSGFSSFVLRYYAAHHTEQADVYSVDDSAVWLSRTEGFLSRHRLPLNNLLLWNDSVLSDCPSFDLILHDLGTMVFRVQTMREVLAKLAPGGVAILDDMQLRGDATKQAAAELKLKVYYLHGYTEDVHGRFAALVSGGHAPSRPAKTG